MKFLWLVGILVGMCAGLVAAPFTFESDTEFQLSVDMNGDGVEDAVIVDRVTGLVRMGYTSPGTGTLTTPDQLSWVMARESGVENVESVSAGYLTAGGVGSLAVAGRGANRVNILSLPDASPTVIPRPVFLPGVGPNLVIIGGGSNSMPGDLIIGTGENSVPSPQHLAFERNNGSAYSSLFDAPLDGPIRAGNMVSLNKVGTADMPAWLATGSESDVFEIFDISGGTNRLFLSTPVPAGSYFIYGSFGTNDTAQFLFWVPGDNHLLSTPIVPLRGGYGFGHEVTYPLVSRIDSLYPIGGAAPNQLLAISANGTHAQLYDYNGNSAPVPMQQFDSARGEQFTGARQRGSFFDLYRGGADGRSTQVDHYHLVRGGAVKTGSDVLPSVSASKTVANVFLFRNEPFVSRAPGLVQTLRAPDWSRAATLGAGSSSLNVVLESYGAGSVGLNHPSSQSISNVNGNASFALPNQIRSDISVASFEIASGDEVVDVRMDPSGGVFGAPVVARFQASPNTATIYYRLGGVGQWRFAPPSMVITNSVSVDYYARLFGAGDRKSRIKTASFVISKGVNPPVPRGPADLDGNLLSDDWERLFRGYVGGNALADSFGNGFSDLQMFLYGNDPANPASVPPVRVNLTPPALSLSSTSGNNLHLEFSYPADYAAQFTFTLMAASSPSGPFSPASTPLVPDQDNVFRADIQPGRSRTGFYIISQELR